MMGKREKEAARVFVEETGISDSISAKDFLVEREAMLRDMFPTSELMPGSSCLIRRMHASKRNTILLGYWKEAVRIAEAMIMDNKVVIKSRKQLADNLIVGERKKL